MRKPGLFPLLAGQAGRLLQRRARRSGSPIGLVLLHHEIAAMQGDPGDLLPPLGADLFRAQLEHLKRHYDVVALRELVARAQERSPGDRIPVAITFDDDLASHASVAAPILEEFGFPATFFLCGKSLNGPLPFWEQDLQLILSRGHDAWSGLRQELADSWPWARLDGRVEDFSNTVKASPPDQRDAIAARLRELAGPTPPDEGLSTEAVKSLVRGGFEIGFHTLRHYSLPTLDARQLDRAMHEGLDGLADVVGYRPTTIAYPYADADLRIAEAAQRAGFELGFVSGHTAVRAEQHLLLLARVVAWANSRGGFDWALGRVMTA